MLVLYARTESWSEASMQGISALCFPDADSGAILGDDYQYKRFLWYLLVPARKLGLWHSLHAAILF